MDTDMYIEINMDIYMDVTSFHKITKARNPRNLTSKLKSKEKALKRYKIGFKALAF
jgi:hypothetical protein